MRAAGQEPGREYQRGEVGKPRPLTLSGRPPAPLPSSVSVPASAVHWWIEAIGGGGVGKSENPLKWCLKGVKGGDRHSGGGVDLS
jgi:hypothetical protein